MTDRLTPTNDDREHAISRRLSTLELDGLESLLEADDLDHDTLCEMTLAVMRLIREVRDSRAELRSLRTRPAEHRRQSEEELIARRQADLTSEEKEALRWLRSAVSHPCRGAECHCSSCIALAALDRLIGAEVRR